MTAFLLPCLVVLFFLSVPIAVSLIFSSILGIEFFGRISLMVVPQQIFNGMDQFTLMAIPFFIFAGNLMEAAGISERIIDLAKSIVGGVRGGLACSCVLTSMMFASVSGSSVATSFAVGSILIPAMARSGYPLALGASVQACSAELGVIIPPSIGMILFGVSAGVSVGDLFMGGIMPGVLIGGALMLWLHIVSRVKGYGSRDITDKPPFLRSLRRAVVGLLMAVCVLGGIYSGIVTPTEASVVAVFYAAIVGLFVFRTLSFRQLGGLLCKSAYASAVVMFLIATALLFNFLISRAGAPAALARFVTDLVDNRYVFLLIVNVCLFLVGMFIETGPAIIVLAPILTPIAVSYGIDPVHFGVLFVINLAIGMFTPPFGVNLFAVSQISGVPVHKLIPYLLPMLGVVALCQLIITYVPPVSLFFTYF